MTFTLHNHQAKFDKTWQPWIQYWLTDKDLGLQGPDCPPPNVPLFGPVLTSFLRFPSYMAHDHLKRPWYMTQWLCFMMVYLQSCPDKKPSLFMNSQYLLYVNIGLFDTTNVPASYRDIPHHRSYQCVAWLILFHVFDILSLFYVFCTLTGKPIIRLKSKRGSKQSNTM